MPRPSPGAVPVSKRPPQRAWPEDPAFSILDLAAGTTAVALKSSPATADKRWMTKQEREADAARKAAGDARHAEFLREFARQLEFNVNLRALPEDQQWCVESAAAGGANCVCCQRIDAPVEQLVDLVQTAITNFVIAAESKGILRMPEVHDKPEPEREPEDRQATLGL